MSKSPTITYNGIRNPGDLYLSHNETLDEFLEDIRIKYGIKRDRNSIDIIRVCTDNEPVDFKYTDETRFYLSVMLSPHGNHYAYIDEVLYVRYVTDDDEIQCKQLLDYKESLNS